ncbi:basic proline-rich protein-like [Prinia subflava]|uniref:basic proline-rich protein-like n=1 Tax=Prinia subflava TaxID=208062 RepID=UPI002FE186F4
MVLVPGTALNQAQRYPRHGAGPRHGTAPGLRPLRGWLRAKGAGTPRGESPRLPPARGDRAGATDTGTARPHRGSLPSGEIYSRGETPSATDPALTPARPRSAHLRPPSCSPLPPAAADSKVRSPGAAPAPSRPAGAPGTRSPPAAPAGRVPAAAYESQDAAGPSAPPPVRPARRCPARAAAPPGPCARREPRLHRAGASWREQGWQSHLTLPSPTVSPAVLLYPETASPRPDPDAS